ncbi:MAG: GTPase, partial [Bacteroidota bacterium]
MSKNTELKDLIRVIERAVELLPDTSRNALKNDLLLLKEMIIDARPPKIMILGRRGAGKSSLVNAIFQEKVAEVGAVLSETGQAQWYDYKNNRGGLRILDTRGLGDRHQPESANFQAALDEIKATLTSDYPDVILFLVKAKEVDARINEDIQNLKLIKDYIEQQHLYKAPIISLVTQVDELDPIDVHQPPYEDQEKQVNIRLALQAVQQAFREESLDLLHSLAISAYARYRDEELVSQRYWNIDRLVNYLIEILPKNAQIELARISQVRNAQKRIARLVVGSSATICGGLAATPLPVADLIPITSA